MLEIPKKTYFYKILKLSEKGYYKMAKVLQFQAVVDPDNNMRVNIFALTDDGRLLIRPTTMGEFVDNKWGEVFFPPKKVKEEKPVESKA